MDPQTFLFAFLTLASWGVSAFVDKLAANRIGVKSIFWNMIGYVPIIVIFVLIAFRAKGAFSGDRTGIWLAVLAGIIGSVGAVGYFTVLTRHDASRSVPLTALYPALTAILAFIFLKEAVTAVKVVGILLATAAIVLLSI